MNHPKPIRFQMIGGFLGAGKTTTIGKLAAAYRKEGMNVGIVTNDQANDLVDTRTLEAQGFSVGEVAGACFCCSFDDLVSTMRSLSLDDMPDVILAEPVGSCTDLVATVAEPIRRFHGSEFETAPYVVLLKPEHGLKILCGESGGFSREAEYIFLKQLEEADVVAINKIDKLTEEQRQSLRSALAERYAGKQILEISARQGDGIQDLAECLSAASIAHGSFMEVDYDVYAEGEAHLGWLNVSYDLEAPEVIAMDHFVRTLVHELAESISGNGFEVAHLKAMVCSDESSSVANVVSSNSDAEISLGHHATGRPTSLVVNARIAMAPEQLASSATKTVQQVTKQFSISARETSSAALRPGRPVPTHSLRDA